TQGSAISGDGRFHLDAVSLDALFDWLPAGLRGQLPFTPEEAAEIGIAASTVDLTVAGERLDGLPRLHFAARTGLTLNRELLAVEAFVDLDAASRAATVRVVVPDFIQARWQLASLRRLTLPEL